MPTSRLPRRKNRNHLSLYRRHAGSCKATNDLSCECPVWCQGRINGRYIRESLATRSLGSAEEKMRAMLDPPPDGPRGPQGLPVVGQSTSLETAKTEFLQSKEGKAPNTQARYASAVGHFVRFAEVRGRTTVRAVTPDLIRSYFHENSSNWQSARTLAGQLTSLRIFFDFCMEMDWITQSPAARKSLSFQAPREQARRPYSADEINRILAAVEQIPDEHFGRPRDSFGRYGQTTAQESGADRDTARALIFVLLYSGMRISDVTFLQRRSITADGLLDYVVIKTHKRIDLPMELHQAAIDALARVHGGGRDFFFLPEGDYREAIQALERGARGDYFAAHLPRNLYLSAIRRNTRLVTRVLELASVEGSCHSFRDTFAVNMLVRGASMDTVSLALGHSDVRITKRHYLNLVPGYRERMSTATRVLDYTRPDLLSSPAEAAGGLSSAAPLISAR